MIFIPGFYFRRHSKPQAVTDHAKNDAAAQKNCDLCLVFILNTFVSHNSNNHPAANIKVTSALERYCIVHILWNNSFFGTNDYFCCFLPEFCCVVNGCILSKVWFYIVAVSLWTHSELIDFFIIHSDSRLTAVYDIYNTCVFVHCG